jgi:hypothetical protein
VLLVLVLLLLLCLAVLQRQIFFPEPAPFFLKHQQIFLVLPQYFFQEQPK